jgi:hypothetical protein
LDFGDTLSVDKLRSVYAGHLMVLAITGKTVREVIENNGMAASDKQTHENQ